MIIPNYRIATRVKETIKLDAPLALLCLLIGALIAAVAGWSLFSFPTLVITLCCILVAAYRCKLEYWR